MKAVRYREFGGPEVLELVEVADPHPGPGQVRVAVRAVGINPIDWKLRSGMMRGDLPQRTGREVAGVVNEVGDGVVEIAAGDAVFGFAAGGAGAAELALLSDRAPIPASLDFAGAAALPVAIETAVRTLDALRVGAGTTVVINGASGAVGSSATQIAVARGARVIGTAGEANQEYVRGLGAEATRYGEGLTGRVRALAPGGVDAGLDAAGGGVLPALVELTGDPDQVITIADYAGAEQSGVRFSGGMGAERAVHALVEIGSLIEASRFHLPVGRTFPLARIADAHRLGETGHVRGKIVLLVE